MRFEDDPDVSGWRADPGRAPGMSKGRLALICGAVVLGLGGVLLVPLQPLWSLVVGSSRPPAQPSPPVAGARLDLKELNGLALHHQPKPPLPTVVSPVAEASPTAPAPADTSLYDGLKGQYDQLRGQYDALNQRLAGLLDPSKPSTPAPPQTTTRVKAVDPEAQRRAEEAKRKRQERLHSTPVFLTRPKDDKPGQLHALKSPYSLAPSEEIPCETSLTVSSETPGAFVVWVSHDVPDTATRTKNVIPQGSKLVVKPRRSAIMGDSRIDVQAQTLTFPSGPWLKLPTGTMMDQYGTAGFTGTVDNHYLRNYGAVILTGVMRAGSSIVAGGYGGSVTERMSGAVAQETTSEATRDLRQAIRTDPTITVNPRKKGAEPTVYACKYLLEDELILTRAYPWTR